MAKGQYTYSEIMSQPDVWTDVLEVMKGRTQETAKRWRDVSPKQVLFTGCGSTHYLAQSAAALLQGMTGIPAQGVPASEIVLFPDETVSNPEETLLVAVSRSGTTTETAAAMTRFRQLGGKAIWGITCYPETPVGQETDFVLLIEAAQEQSVAQTRSFSSMLLLTQALAAIAGGEDTSPLARLPAAGASILEQNGELAQSLGASPDLRRFFFLGSGPLYGIACEVMLKMKEMSISYSEAYHFMEFRHGPKSMVDEHGLVVGLLSQRAQQHEAPVLTESMKMGGTSLALSPGTASIQATECVVLPEDVPGWARPVLYLPMMQLMAYHRSISKGLDPDNPRNLTAVIELDIDSLVEGATG
jgi:glucosamine--fructose-6-phosphate aminotransferase (isomerizing)